MKHNSWFELKGFIYKILAKPSSSQNTVQRMQRMATPNVNQHPTNNKNRNGNTYNLQNLGSERPPSLLTVYGVENWPEIFMNPPLPPF